MKIHDIIAENNVDEMAGLVGAGIARGAGLAKSAIPKIAKKVIPKVTKTIPKSVPKSVPKTTPKSTPKSTTPKSQPKTSGEGWWDSQALKYADKVKGKEVELAKGALKSAVLKAQADDIVKILTLGQMGTEAAVYWYKSNELDKKLAAGQITKEQYESELRTLRGLAITALIAPKIGSWVGGKLATVTGLKLIPWLTKVSGSPNAAEAMKYLTSKAVQAGIISWMTVGGGKDWLKDTFGVMITGVGNIPELAGTVYEAMKAIYQTATGTGAAAELNKQRADGVPGSEPTLDPNDPMSIMGKAVGGAFADPFKGTGRKPSTL